MPAAIALQPRRGVRGGSVFVGRARAGGSSTHGQRWCGMTAEPSEANPDRVGLSSGSWLPSATCSPPPRPRSPRSTPPAAADRIAAGAVVLDVREPDEYDQGALPDAIHIPRGHLEAQVEGRLLDKHGAGRRLLRRRRAQRVRRQDARRAGLHRRGRRWPVASASGRTKAAPGRPRSRSPPSSATATSATCCCPRWASAGQAKLLGAKVLMLGAGGLGSPSALYLAAAGVGTIGIVDMDEVDASNLQRQILHNIDRIGDRKVDSAKKTLTLLNPDVDVVTYDTRLDAGNIIDIITGYDVIVDGADNFPSRYLLNDASVKLGIPVVHGSDLPLRGHGQRVPPAAGPHLPRHGARAAARRAGAELRRGRRARRAARHRRQHPGARGDQAASSASASRSSVASCRSTPPT